MPDLPPKKEIFLTGLWKDNPVLRQGVNVRGGDVRAAVVPHIPVTQVIGKKDQDVRPPLRGRTRRCRFRKGHNDKYIYRNKSLH